jgi:D-cysteine desulfhydrase
MNLGRFPRRRYADGPTPLQPLARLTEALGGPDLFIKRDDLLGFAAGGNKIRKLEFVVADALQKGADYLITCGAVQSNHCRLTLAAAVREGLKCGLVLEERVAGSYKPQASGNNFLYRLMGVDRIKVAHGGSDLMGAMADEVKAQSIRFGKGFSKKAKTCSLCIPAARRRCTRTSTAFGSRMGRYPRDHHRRRGQIDTG